MRLPVDFALMVAATGTTSFAGAERVGASRIVASATACLNSMPGQRAAISAVPRLAIRTGVLNAAVNVSRFRLRALTFAVLCPASGFNARSALPCTVPEGDDTLNDD